MNKDTFLFVPYKSGEKSSQGRRATESEARSHAASVSRQRRESKLKSSEHGRSTSVSSSNNLVSQPPDQDEDTLQPTSNTLTLKTPPTRTQEQRRQNMRAMQFSWRAGTVGSIQNDMVLSNGWRTDPFAMVPNGTYVDAVMDYYAQVIIPVNHPIYAIFDVTNVYTTFFFELLQDDDYVNAGLAMVGAVMKGVAHPGSEPTDDVKWYQAKAIKRLQDKWKDATTKGENPADDAAIIAVLALASLARFLGERSSYENHRKDLGAMVRSRGGLDSLGHNGLAKSLLMQWDSFWVFSTEGSSLFPDSRPQHVPVYPAFPLSVDLRKNFEKLPVGFQTLVVQGKISVELVEILVRAADASESGIDSIVTGNKNHSQPRKYNDFVEACPCLGQSGGSEPNLEKQLCLALLLYCANAFTDARSSTALYGGARGELTRILTSSDRPWKTLPEDECGLWICAVCVDSWRMGDAGSPLLSQGMAILPIFRTRVNGRSLEHILRKFFYDENFIRTCLSYTNTRPDKVVLSNFESSARS